MKPLSHLTSEDRSHRVPGIVALTGGIGSGKSVVRKMFEKLGVPCIDADLVARTIHQDPAHPATRQIAQAFPESAAPDGTLRRGSLRARFANDEEANRKLKRILKPHVMAAILQWTHAQKAPYVIWESALILDENIPADRVLVVDAPDEIRVARIRARNPDWPIEQINNILAAQLPRATYLQAAQDVIQNDASLESLRKRVDALHRMYLEIWER